MSSYNFNDPTQRWLITGNRLRSSNNTLLKIDASGSSSNIRFSKNDASLCVIGTNVDACSNSVLNSCALSVGSSDFSNNTNINTFGAYYSFGETTTQLAFGSTATRSSIGRPGYIRYNTDDNGFEFWNVLTSSWATVTTPTPTFTSISPNYVPEDSSFNYTVTGTNFASGAIIQFISVSGGITYSTAGTTFISTTQLETRNTLTMSNDGGGVTGAGTSGYRISITNPTGTNFTSAGAVLTFNQGPIWITAVNTNLGTGIANTSYTYATTPFSDLSAVDTGAVIHNPVKFFLDPSGSTIAGATSVTLDPSGRLIGTTPNVASSTTYTFNAYPLDASGVLGPVRQFAFTVGPIALTRVSGPTLPTPIYVNASNTVVGSPVVGGFTIYSFTDTSSPYVVTINSTVTSNVQYLIIAGGGGGGPGFQAGGGGAGGVLLSPAASLTTSTNYTITVGAGGAGGNNSGSLPSAVKGSNGSNSSLIGGVLSLTATGGGGGGSYNNGQTPLCDGLTGGSGGGAGAFGPSAQAGGNGGAGTPSQGNAGGGCTFSPSPSAYQAPYCGGGGGGYGGAGATGGGANLIGDGGIGITSTITGTSTNYAGGGGGGSYQLGPSVSRVANRSGTTAPSSAQSGTGGEYGGGYGALGTPSYYSATDGQANTGAGGGGGALSIPSFPPPPANDPGAAGGSGIVIIRFPSF